MDTRLVFVRFQCRFSLPRRCCEPRVMKGGCRACRCCLFLVTPTDGVLLPRFSFSDAYSWQSWRSSNRGREERWGEGEKVKRWGGKGALQCLGSGWKRIAHLWGGKASLRGNKGKRKGRGEGWAGEGKKRIGETELRSFGESRENRKMLIKIEKKVTTPPPDLASPAVHLGSAGSVQAMTPSHQPLPNKTAERTILKTLNEKRRIEVMEHLRRREFEEKQHMHIPICWEF